MIFLQKKWHCCCCLVLALFSFKAYAQININGRVVDETDNTPLPGASVYFNNTTIGTRTDLQGYFNFEAVHLVNTEVVIFTPGYELLAYRLLPEKVEGKRVVFKLRAKKQVINKLTLTNAVRKRCLEIFSNFFLGITREASRCTIVNINSMYFAPGESNTSFLAYADTPLVIMNDLLGYKINFKLEEFRYDDATGEGYLFGYTRYENLGNDRKWIKNRRDCYYGSTLHFYRSLITNQLYEQGFGTFLLKKVTDTSKYLQEPGQQIPGPGKVRAEPVSAQQILYIDSANNFSIRVAGELLVQYNKNPSSKEFLKRASPVVEGDLEKGTESSIIFKAPSVGLNYAGVLSDAGDVAYSGYWIYEKAANLLPFDYQP